MKKIIALALLAVVVAAGPVPASASTYQLGGSINATCGTKDSKVTGGQLSDLNCMTSILAYDSDTGDIYSCAARFEFWFLNGKFQQQIANSVGCNKVVSLPHAQTVDSKSNQLLPDTLNLGPGYTEWDASKTTYWYLNKQGAVGVCMFMSVNLPQPTYPTTPFGNQTCADTKL
jgi:hypothetical protein